MHLMGRDRDQIRTQGLGLERYFHKALHRIGVEDGIGADPMGQLRHLGDGHDRTAFIVDHHNGHQNGILAQSGL